MDMVGGFSIFPFLKKVRHEETHLVGTREIQIIFECDTEEALKRVLSSTVLDMFENDPFASRLPYITIIFSPDEKVKEVDIWGAYYSNEGNYIQLKIGPFIEYFKTSIVGTSQKLRSVLSHEFIHPWHNLKNALDRADYIRSRIQKIKKKIDDDLRDYAIHDIRKKLFTFISSIQEEGLAQFYQEIVTFGYPDQTDFGYNAAKNTAENLRNIFMSFTGDIIRSDDKKQLIASNRQFTEKFKRDFMTPGGGVYTIGYHMVFLMLNERKKNLVDAMEDLASMNHLRFIKEYEKAAKRYNLRPIVSVTSGKGILDYSEMVSGWMNAIKENSRA